MPVSRPVLPGSTYTIMRRTTRRFFVLRPDEQMTQLFWYLLAVMAERHGVEVHAVECLATHYHAVVTDVRATLPLFLADFHRALAMTVKSLRGWDEEVWNKSQTSRLDLATSDAIVDQCAYAIANCVEAGVVDRPSRYPGAKTLASDIGTAVIRQRRPNNPWLVDEDLWPEEAELRIVLPEALEAEYGAERARQAIQDATDVKVQRARAERKRHGLGYVGAKEAMRVPVTVQSTKPEARRRLNPTFAVGAGNREAFFGQVARLRAWREAYRAAFLAWCAGRRDVEFPPGTWKMRVVHGACVALE